MSENNQLEFKVVDNNADFMSHLFGDEPKAAVVPATPAAPAAPVAPVQAATETQQAAPAPAAQVLDSKDAITNDDLLGMIGANASEDGSKPAESAVPAQQESQAGKTPSAPAAAAPSLDIDTDEVKLRNKIYTEHLIAEGIWQPIDGIDEIDFSTDNLKKIVDIQTGLRAESVITTQWDSLRKSSKYIETIFDYVEQDKDPSEIIGLFQQQKEIADSLDFNSVDGTIEAIRKFYTEKSTPKWDLAKTNRYIKNLELEGEDAVKSEGKFVQEQFGEVFESERLAKVEALNKEAKKEEEDRKAEIRSNYTLLKNKGFTDVDAQKLLADVYQPKYTKAGSNKLLTELDAKLEKIKEDPDAYLDYVQFVLDRENYKRSLATKEVSANNNDIWKKLKSGEKPKSESVSIANRANPSSKNIYEQLITKK